MSLSNSGKYLEEAFEDECKLIEDAAFHWRRLPDARAARGRIPAQPADYFFSFNGRSCHLDCKTHKGSKPRLPKFTQLPDMRRWAKAGVKGYVLVHFYDIDALYLVDIEELEDGKPSWVLGKEYEIKDVAEALRRLRG